MTNYTLHHGDCLDILPTLPPSSVDAVIADPPYGTTACKWDSVIPFDAMWRELKRIVKSRGAIVLFGSQPFTSALVMSNPKWFRYEWVWQKNKPTGSLNVIRQPMRSHENILVFSSNSSIYNPQKIRRTPEEYRACMRTNTTVYGQQNGIYGEHPRSAIRVRPPVEEQWFKHPHTVLVFSRDEKRDGSNHPTQKPLALMEYLVKTYTNEGDTVLDFTFGSGTTGEACINTGRDFIGIERDKGYYDIASKRLSDAAARMVQMEIAI